MKVLGCNSFISTAHTTCRGTISEMADDERNQYSRPSPSSSASSNPEEVVLQVPLSSHTARTHKEKDVSEKKKGDERKESPAANDEKEAVKKKANGGVALPRAVGLSPQKSPEQSKYLVRYNS